MGLLQLTYALLEALPAALGTRAHLGAGEVASAVTHVTESAAAAALAAREACGRGVVIRDGTSAARARAQRTR